jgi:hypothetical protein
MKFDWKTNRYTLSSGRTVYAFMDMLSLDDDGVLHYGSDGLVRDNGEAVDFSPEERREIARYFIDRWQRWAAGADVVRPEWKAQVDAIFEAWTLDSSKPIDVPTPCGAAEAKYLAAKSAPASSSSLT